MSRRKPERLKSMENAVSTLPTPPASSPTPAPAVASRGKIVAMAIVAGAVITNIYCTQPILPLIAAGLRVNLTTVDLVAGAALLGFSTGLALLLPLGDRFDRRKLVLAQIALAFAFAVAAAIAPGIWALIAASFGLGIVSCVPQQLVPFAAVMSQPTERGRGLWLARGLRAGSGVYGPGLDRCSRAAAARLAQHKPVLRSLARVALAAGARPSADS